KKERKQENTIHHIIDVISRISWSTETGTICNMNLMIHRKSTQTQESNGPSITGPDGIFLAAINICNEETIKNHEHRKLGAGTIGCPLAFGASMGAFCKVYTNTQQDRATFPTVLDKACTKMIGTAHTHALELSACSALLAPV
ncbi:hypothetical protein ACJX0J_023457, partial [Zea mays]